MRWSITTRILVAVNAVALAIGLATGWISIRLVTRAAEKRLLHEPASNAVRLIAALRLPCSDRLARELKDMTSCETAFVCAAPPGVVASSLPQALREALGQALAAEPLPGRITVDRQRYVVAAAAVPQTTPAVRLVLLLPADALAAVDRRGTWRVVAVTLAAVLATTALGAAIAHSVTRSLRALAGDAARMTAALEASHPGASGAGLGATDARHPDLRFQASAAPAEVASLAASFNQVLDRLETTRHDLEHAARLAALGQLAAAVVHELRNPLCGIQMNARVLADSAAQRGERDPSLDLIVREVGRMDLFLQELLLLSGRPPPVEAASGAPPAAVLQTAVASTLALAAGRARHAGVVVVDETEAAGAVRLGVAAGPLRQVLLNLVLNGLDAMPNGGTLTLAASRLPAGGARVEVRDTGHGVHGEPGEDIFAPFVSHRPGGSGLGLYVCRQIVERHGGRIGYAARPAGGTTFWFELPSSTAPAVSGEAAATTT